jgi:hypothetical protein
VSDEGGEPRTPFKSGWLGNSALTRMTRVQVGKVILALSFEVKLKPRSKSEGLKNLLPKKTYQISSLSL